MPPRTPEVLSDEELFGGLPRAAGIQDIPQLLQPPGVAEIPREARIRDMSLADRRASSAAQDPEDIGLRMNYERFMATARRSQNIEDVREREAPPILVDPNRINNEWIPQQFTPGGGPAVGAVSRTTEPVPNTVPAPLGAGPSIAGAASTPIPLGAAPVTYAPARSATSTAPSSEVLTDEELLQTPMQREPSTAVGGRLSSDPEFREFIKGEEGYTRRPQWDYKQYSSGYGTRWRPGDPIGNREHDERRLTEELDQAEDLVDRFKPNLPVGAKKALVDLTFNSGIAWQRAGLGKAVQNEDWEEARSRFLQYKQAGGKDLGALVRRRGRMAPEFAQGGMGFGAAAPAARGGEGAVLSDEELFGDILRPPAPTEPGAVATPTTTPTTPQASSALGAGVPEVRGLVSGATKENAELVSDFLEGMGDLFPDKKESLQKKADSFKEMAKNAPEAYARQTEGLFKSIEGGKFKEWFREELGSGLASTTPGIAAGVGGALAGGAVGGPTGAAVGGFGSALAVGAAMNFAEARKTFREEGFSGPEATKLAGYVTPALAALDVPIVGQVFRTFPGLRKEIVKGAARGIAKRVAVEGAKGAVLESVPEAIQEAIPLALSSYMQDKPFATMKNAEAILTGAIGGAGVGGVVGGVTGIPRDMTSGAPPATEDLAAAYQDVTQRTPPPGAPPVVAAPAAPPPSEVPIYPPEPPGPQPFDPVNYVPTPEPGVPVPEGVESSSIMDTIGGLLGPSSAQAAARGGGGVTAAPPPTPTEVTTPTPEGAGVPPPPAEEFLPETLPPAVTRTEQVPPPEGGLPPAIPAEEPPVGPAVPPFYPKIRDEIQQKMPAQATPEQVLGTLRGKVKAEELADTGFEEWLRTQGPKVSKADALEFLRQNEIPFEETINSDSVSVQPGENTPARYRTYITPGPIAGYKELVLHAPEGRPQGKRDVGQYQSPHYSMRNIYTTSRFTLREDITGTPTLVIEEIQDDTRQRGAKFGYEGDPKYGETLQKKRRRESELRALLDSKERRYYNRDDPAYSVDYDMYEDPEYKAAQEELRDVHEWLHEAQYDLPKGGIPFKKSWVDLSIKRILRYAADRGISRVAIARPEDQTRRYPTRDAKKVAGTEKFYREVAPNKLKDAAKQLGSNSYGMTKIKARRESFTIFYTDRHGYENQARGYNSIEDAQSEVDYLLRNHYRNVRMEPEPPDPNEEEYHDVVYVDVPPAGRALVRARGMTTHTQQIPGQPMLPGLGTAPAAPIQGATNENGMVYTIEDSAKNHPFVKAAMQGVRAVNEVAKLVGLQGRVHYRIVAARIDPRTGERYAPGWLDTYEDPLTGRRELMVNLLDHDNRLELWSSLTHEFGHLVMYTKYAAADDSTKAAVDAAFQRWQTSNGIDLDTNIRDLFLSRDSINGMRLRRYRGAGSAQFETRTIRSITPLDDLEYWVGFNEFFAEQVARWASTDIVPVTILDRFMARAAKSLMKIHELIYKRLGMTFRPEPEIAEWMNSFVRSSKVDMQSISAEFLERTRRKNQKLIDEDSPEVAAVAQTPATSAARDALGKVFDGNPPRELQKDAAWADRFNKVYEWGLNIIQIAKRNPHIPELQAYREDLQNMHNDVQKIMAAAHYTLKQLRALGPKQEEAAYKVMDELDRMTYRTDREKADGVARNPTLQEFTAITSRHKLGTEGLKSLRSMQKMFDDFLTANERATNAIAQETLTDPVKLMDALTEIQHTFNLLRSRPYFPHMQFGEHMLVVRNANGRAIHVESFERQGVRSAQQVRASRIKELKSALLPGETIQESKWSKDAQPFIGMPKALLDLMAEKMELSISQRGQLEQLRLAAAPVESFRHRFQRRKNIPGYSMDFRRAFAMYFFHGAHFYGKAKYVDKLRGHIKDLKNTIIAKDANGNLVYPDSDNRADIVNYLTEHLQEQIDVKSEWAALRAFTFVWALGFSPVAAAINMSQSLVGTYPMLGKMFGDAKAMKAMAQAGADLRTFYSKGRIEGMTAEADFAALDEGIRDGTITEAMSPQLAATSQDNNLFYGQAGNLLQRGWINFMEKSAVMFELAEQFNRRLAFRATWKLALENPDAKFIEDSVKANPLKFKRLTDSVASGGKAWSIEHARAYIAAKEVVESTQYVYAPYARAKMFRGKLGTLLMFQSFVQNTLFMLGNYPGVRLRSLLMMGAIGGLMGLPFADEIGDLMRVFAWRVFGKDFDMKREIRQFLLDMSGGKIPADLVLHGLSRRGFGIPTILDMMAAPSGYSSVDAAMERFTTGRSEKPHVPFPIADLSKSFSFRVLPVDLDVLFGPPTKDESKVIADQVQRASGAAFGSFFNLFKAASDSRNGVLDLKRYERTMPRALAAATKAFRAGWEGEERTKSGATFMTYDVHDTEQLAELVSWGLGAKPLASSARWDQVMAVQEADKFLDYSRGILLTQYSEALQRNNQEDLEKVKGSIREFNRGLPDHARAKAITTDTIKRSMQGRARERTAQETGIPVRKTSRGVAKHIQDLFPEATDARRVPASVR